MAIRDYRDEVKKAFLIGQACFFTQLQLQNYSRTSLIRIPKGQSEVSVLEVSV